jgi:hypothetical protein
VARRALLVAALLAAACQPTVQKGRLPPGDYTPRPEDNPLPAPPGREEEYRRDALRRARVRLPLAVPVAEADLSRNPPEGGALREDEVVDCRFLLKPSEGFTPKFQCIRPGGEILRVKYGRYNAEVFAELATTRLLSALGFGADRMYRVAKVRCFGCPTFPYPRVGILDSLLMDYGKVTEFTPVVVERRLRGREIRTPQVRGWGFFELDTVDPAAGGASRAEVDAFRLMAAFLANWDSKPSNQRLLCLPGGEPAAAGGPCRTPFAMMQDVGRTFGPRYMDVGRWSATPLWADPATCLVSMKGLPYDGATFSDVQVGEEGRRLLADMLGSLREEQVRGLFVGARFAEYVQQPVSGRDPETWVRAFQHRVRQLVDRPPCPTP